MVSQSGPSSEKKRVETGSARSSEATPWWLNKFVREVIAAMKLPGIEKRGKNRIIAMMCVQLRLA